MTGRNSHTALFPKHHHRLQHCEARLDPSCMLNSPLYQKLVRLANLRDQACNLGRASFQDLPSELVVDILSQLSALDIVQWQAVSRHFRAIVAGSVILQYIIECYLSDILEEPLSVSRSKEEQLDAIREWSEAWKTARWRGDVILAAGKTAGPKPIRGSATRPWILESLSMVTLEAGYATCTDTDVLILPEFPDATTIRLTTRTLSEGKPHPLLQKDAQEMVLNTQMEVINPEDRVIAIIIRGSLVLSYKSYSGHPDGSGNVVEMWVHHWKMGKLLMHFWGDRSGDLVYSDYAILDDKHILITVHGRNPFLVAVFDMDKVDPSYQSLTDLLHSSAVLLLELPLLKPAPRVECPSLKISCQSRREVLPYHYTDVKFTPANSTPLICLHLPIYLDGRKHKYEMLIPWTVVSSRLGRAGGFSDSSRTLTPVAWDDWGIETRFLEPDIDRRWHRAVEGSRYATRELDTSSGQKVFTIYDFRPHPMLLRDLLLDGNADIIVEPTHICNNEIFDSPCITTKAPYRRVRTDVVLADNKVPFLSEDIIIIWRVLPSGQGSAHHRTLVI